MIVIDKEMVIIQNLLKYHSRMIITLYHVRRSTCIHLQIITLMYRETTSMPIHMIIIMKEICPRGNNSYYLFPYFMINVYYSC